MSTTTGQTTTVWTKVFWKAATERAIKSLAQGLIVLFGASKVFNVMEVDWQQAAGVAGGLLVLSYLTSLASSLVTGDGPSLTNNEVLASKPEDHLRAA